MADSASALVDSVSALVHSASATMELRFLLHIATSLDHLCIACIHSNLQGTSCKLRSTFHKLLRLQVVLASNLVALELKLE
jgi:hypothetical protein